MGDSGSGSEWRETGFLFDVIDELLCCSVSVCVKCCFVLFDLCSVERSPPIEEVIQAGVVPRFVEFLVREDFPQLQVLFYSLHWKFLCGVVLMTFVVLIGSLFVC